MYEDDYFRKNTWIWDGKPHWAYAQPRFMKLIQDRDALYWTPNTIASSVLIEGNVAHIKLCSETPNLKEYQMKQLPSEEWKAVDSQFDLKLEKRKTELIFRAVNKADVSGPAHRIIIDSY
jgi:hypothetical protein